MTDNTAPSPDPATQHISRRTLLFMMLIAAFIGAVISATIVGINDGLVLQVKSIINDLNNGSPQIIADPVDPTPVATVASENCTIRGEDTTCGGYILLSLDELEHFLYSNIEANAVFTEIQTQIDAYGNENRLIEEVSNLISFDNAETEIQRPGGAFELLMSSLYQILEHYNNTGEPHLPCAVILADFEVAREIEIQLRIPPGSSTQGVIHHETPVSEPVNPVSADEGRRTDVVCYFPPQ